MKRRQRGGDGCRFCGDTHNNQTDHGEGGVVVDGDDYDDDNNEGRGHDSNDDD